MSFHHSPRIVTDGLVLCLDAANPKSYPGSGTVWTDLVAGNNGTLTNGPTFNSNNGGSIVFDRASSQTVGSFPGKIATIGTKTICSWVYLTTTSRAELAGTRSFPAASNGWALVANITSTGINSPGRILYFHPGAASLQSPLNSLQTNIWSFVCVTLDVPSTTCIIYLNGSPIASTSSFTPNGTESLSTDTGQIGFANNAGYWGGNVAQFYIYNTALTSDQILQNYNATKGRFNL